MKNIDNVGVLSYRYMHQTFSIYDAVRARPLLLTGSGYIFWLIVKVWSPTAIQPSTPKK